MRAFLLFAVSTLLLLLGCRPPSDQQGTAASAPGIPYLERRAKFKTNLIRRGPSPQDWQVESPPEGVEQITYQSGGLELPAWLFIPPTEDGNKVPAIVYFHGGFAFGASDFFDCKPFLDAGFAVMCPILRGENGNAGEFEFALGEVDDGKAAVNWLASHPEIDSQHIYTFGHSSGGMISALLSLMEDVPARHGGSSGGLYGPELDVWPTGIEPFDVNSDEERQMRSLVGNLRDMQRDHYAYIGNADMIVPNIARAKREMAGSTGRLHLVELSGDHFTSLPIAMQEYVKVIQRDLPASGDAKSK